MHHLIIQLHSRYPTSSLISELLTVHDGAYVVRALVQIGGTTLATGMAAAANIEAAEDRAKIRALEALGITASSASLIHSALPVASGTSLQPMDSPALTTDSAAQLSQRSSAAAATPSGAIATPTPSTLFPKNTDFSSPTSSMTVGLEPDADFNTEFNIDNTEFYLSNSDEDESNDYPLSDPEQEDPLQTNFTSTASPKPSRPKRNSKVNSVNSEPKLVETFALYPEEPIDNSDVIAQIDVEMRRLGWGRDQGRKHLKETYGKLSRQQLTDAELLDFLHYLEAQP